MERYNISSSPHDRADCGTDTIMLDVILALFPATVVGILWFGFQAFLIVFACIVTAMLTEYLYQKGMKKKVTIGDYSAIVTGLLIALNMPPEIPVWIPMLGTIFAILVVKQLFGGLGQNFMNPALAGRCFLLIAFAGQMTRFTVDGVSTATPLAMMKNGESVELIKMFLGQTGGTIGETCTLALLIGGLYLILKKVISPRIPVSYILTFLVFMLLFSGHDIKDWQYYLGQLCGGGLMLGAFFMATDYVTSPITPNGKIVFGIILGILTGLFRTMGNSAEGVSYAIIIGNLLVPFIEKFTVPTAFGKGKNQFSFSKTVNAGKEGV